MDRNLDTLRRHGRRWLAATGLLALAAAGSAHAGGNVGISVGIHVPGAPVYVMPPPPPPRAVYYAPPPPAVVYQAPPAYGYWAPPRRAAMATTSPTGLTSTTSTTTATTGMATVIEAMASR